MSLPVPTRLVAEPPTTALPPLPPTKPARTSLSQTPSRLKAPSRPLVSPILNPSLSTTDLPALRSGSFNATNSASSLPTVKTVRRVISIGAFPQPPSAVPRPTTSSSMTSTGSNAKRASDGSGTGISTSGSKSKRRPRISTASTGSYRSSQTPSLLNSAGDGKTIPLGGGNRISDAQSSIHSPPHSRSSSANGSYSTSATTFEDADDELRGRPKEIEEPALDSKRNSRTKESKGNVIVSVRVRPDVGAQENTQTEGEWMVDGRRALIAYRGREGGDYHYDNVFGTYDDNAKVYDSAAKRLVRRVMEGYHGTVFAYGMTGTGKTFSMQGTMTSPGVIPLAITDIFSYIRETPQREFLLRVSYLEIYNEKIHDLLATPVGGGAVGGGQSEEIKIREDSKRGVYASPLKEEIVQSPTQLLRVIHRGDTARRTSSTQYNARSSRSHAVVQIVVESRERITGNSSSESKRVAMLPGGVRVSTLSLIDLAGSERAAEDKERRTEGAHINKSLLTLGNVIAKLSGNKDKNGNPTDKDGKHLPYRESKLTRLLQPALSGNSLVSILCTIQIGSHGSIATSHNHTGETLNTLKFAARAKNNIVSHAKRAVEEIGGGVNAGLLERYRTEIQSLRSQLDQQQRNVVDKEEKQLEKEAEQRHEEQMLEMQLARTALKERIEHLNRLILCSKSTGVNSGTASALGMHSRLSGGTSADFTGTRSVRSSASQSTLGATPNFVRHPSLQSLGGGIGQSGHLSYSAVGDEDDEAGGEFGDGRASLQAQNRALQADLQDKNRYITTLERRLLQARRTSHSRVSVGFNKNGTEEDEVGRELAEKDSQIADLQRTVAVLRSAMRKREQAEFSAETASSDIKSTKSNLVSGSNRNSNDSKISNPRSGSDPKSPTPTPKSPNPKSPSVITPVQLLSPQKNLDLKRKSVDEMSKMLDEMIQDKVESGQLIKGRTGSVRMPPRSASAQRYATSTQRHSRRNSSSAAATVRTGIPTMGSLVATLRERDSILEMPNSA